MLAVRTALLASDGKCRVYKEKLRLHELGSYTKTSALPRTEGIRKQGEKDKEKKKKRKGLLTCSWPVAPIASQPIQYCTRHLVVFATSWRISYISLSIVLDWDTP